MLEDTSKAPGKELNQISGQKSTSHANITIS